ncbi:magnesium transporter CorA [Streptomyces sp. F-3]|uniref:magnesium and cobalt transport protein CorA n=1 Tax=Streptomyces TaxID=1883 RepID=UPI0007C30C0F|nr:MULTISPECIES: magnesium and cobalt transport protein CorA [Streptomyces]MDN5381314.1 magnesium and cobalt transport protein CorA [Streptomyces sp. LB8]GAT82147.1 magnesium transporter CorA [Streptomyces sp. F-3]
MIVDCAVYRDGRRAPGPGDFSGALAEARAVGGFVRVELYEPDEQEFGLVAEELSLHPLAVEDALKAHQRPKLEVYDDSLFVVLKSVIHEPRRDALATGEIMVFLGDAFAVTVRHGESDGPEAVRRRLEQEPELLRRGPTSVLYAIVDSAVDHYLRVATELQTDLEELETEVFSPDRGGSRPMASRIYDFKRRITEFRRATGPLALPMSRLAGTGTGSGVLPPAVPFVDDRARPFFRDVSDHLTRVNESVESLDRSVSDILSAHLAQITVQQNDDMRKISAWAALAAIPTVIAGIYGMNFSHMPELHWSWSYPAVIVLMALLELLLYRLLKQRGWL